MAEESREELLRKVSMAQEMLGRVIHTTDNLDDKVGRAFSSMSFLTVGATILYSSFLANKLLYRVGGVDLISLLFVLFIMSVAASTVFMLQAMGPRVHLNPWKGNGQRSSAEPIPTGYADRIATMNEEKWMEYFQRTPLNEIYEKWYASAMGEAHALSKKVDKKVGEMRSAQRFFLLSIASLVLMVVLAAASYL